MCRHQFKGQDLSRHCLTHLLNSYHTLTLRPNIKGGTAGFKYLRSYILSRGMLEKQSCWAHKIMLAFHWRLKKWAEIEKVRQGPGMNHKLIT